MAKNEPFLTRREIPEQAQNPVMEVKDSNGNLLSEGDSVTVIKDLKVRGSSAVIKRGTKVKNIRLTDDEEEVEGKVDGSVIVLKACFLKKA
jgi:protein PhnA